MNGRDLDAALTSLRVHVLLRLAQRLGFETDADEVRRALRGLTDALALDQIAAAHRTRFPWKKLRRWVRTLGGLRNV